jgi:hypothetical protein
LTGYEAGDGDDTGRLMIVLSIEREDIQRVELLDSWKLARQLQAASFDVIMTSRNCTYLPAKAEMLQSAINVKVEQNARRIYAEDASGALW